MAVWSQQMVSQNQCRPDRQTVFIVLNLQMSVTFRKVLPSSSKFGRGGTGGKQPGLLPKPFLPPVSPRMPFVLGKTARKRGYLLRLNCFAPSRPYKNCHICNCWIIPSNR